MDTLAAVASMATASPLFQIPSAPSIKLVSNANSSILEGMMTSQDQQKTSTSNSPREDSASVTAVVASVNSVTTTTAATTTAVGVPAATSTTAPANGTSKSEQLPIGTSIVTPPMRMILKELHTPKPVPVRQYPVVPEIPAHITMDEFGLIQACEKGVVKSVRQIFNTNMKYYSNIDQQFLSSYGVSDLLKCPFLAF